MNGTRKFSEYAEFLGDNVISCCITDDFEVESVCANSAFTEKNSIFCAVKGVKVDGNDFIGKALEQGASGVISSQTEIACKNFIRVADDRLAYGEAQRFFCGEADKEIKFLGVTGTNGKTTTVYLFFHLLRELGCKPAFFSTVANFDGAVFRSSDCTTPEAGELFSFCRKAADNGSDFAIFECSSHALSQCRFGRALFQAAIFTNLTGDHLDYHCDIQSYFEAKKRLFSDHLVPDGTAVINIDDEYGKILADELRGNGRKVLTFGFSETADMQMKIFEDVWFLNGCKVESSFFGRYNFYNITGVLGVLMSLGFELERTLDVLKKIECNVPGRLEKIDIGKHGIAFVDYAHTEDALKNVLGILKSEAEKRHGRIICVFGCGGDRDKTKRPCMGRVASELADEFILTSDNPRSEDPSVIIEDILRGCVKKPFAIETDRRKAINFAVAAAGENDIVLVAGKGHEKEQEIGQQKCHFDDCEILRNYMEIGGE